MNNDIKAHIVAIEQWIARQQNNVRLAKGLSSEEREQLHVVNKSIKQLSRLGVSIPDELRKLKLQLSAKDVEFSSILGSAHEHFAEVAEMVSALNKLTQDAKALYNQLKTPDNDPQKI